MRKGRDRWRREVRGRGTTERWKEEIKRSDMVQGRNMEELD